ncbi:hypothetical protein RND81_10G023200 [Saponaria officinalis]|uniref:Uncharacterized protein n=1 Tax=Saponaria officinalis TaxID=3572 RepID=A0AAW1HZJ2_SAPOF
MTLVTVTAEIRQVYPPPLTFLHVQLIFTSSLLSPWLMKLRIEGLAKELQHRVNVVCSMKRLKEDQILIWQLLLKKQRNPVRDHFVKSITTSRNQRKQPPRL